MGLYYGEGTNRRTAPPESAPSGLRFASYCADCGERQPVEKVVRQHEGGEIVHVAPRRDRRCSECPTLEATKTQEPSGRRWPWRRWKEKT